MEVLKVVMSAMFGFHRFNMQYCSCMFPCTLDELLYVPIMVKIICLHNRLIIIQNMDTNHIAFVGLSYSMGHQSLASGYQ